jgi:hypothetical protein
VQTYCKECKAASIPHGKDRSPETIKKVKEANKRISLSPKGRFKQYINDAARKPVPFNLTYDEFMAFWQKPCHYCGDAIQTIGLDRIDSSRGYSLDNVVSCCGTCNKMKLIMSIDEFILHCKKIVTHWIKNHLATSLEKVNIDG